MYITYSLAKDSTLFIDELTLTSSPQQRKKQCVSTAFDPSASLGKIISMTVSVMIRFTHYNGTCEAWKPKRKLHTSSMPTCEVDEIARFPVSCSVCVVIRRITLFSPDLRRSQRGVKKTSVMLRRTSQLLTSWRFYSSALHVLTYQDQGQIRRA